jgi:hypothetical protein
MTLIRNFALVVVSLLPICACADELAAAHPPTKVFPEGRMSTRRTMRANLPAGTGLRSILPQAE